MLGSVAKLTVVRLANTLTYLGFVYKWVIKQAQLELLPQQSAGRLVDAFLAQLSGFHQLQYQLRTVFSPELITTSVDNFLYALRFRQVLSAPGPRRPDHIRSHGHVGQQAPIGTNHTVVLVFVAQQVGDDGFVVSHGHILISLPGGDAIVRHDGSGIHFERCLKRDEVIVKVLPRINLSFLNGKVGVEPFLLRPAAGEVLRHTGDAPLIEAFALQPFDISRDHTGTQRRILSKGTADPRPSGLRSQVNLWV